MPGRSTLITSAPKSASICVAHGPDSTRLRSSTRILESSPLMSFPSGAELEVAVVDDDDLPAGHDGAERGPPPTVAPDVDAQRLAGEHRRREASAHGPQG